MKMKVFVVLSAGGAWSNDDSCSTGISGVYSSFEKAKDEVRNFMLEECKNFDDEEDFDAMSFKDLQDMWCLHFETEEFIIFERELDGVFLGLEPASFPEDTVV